MDFFKQIQEPALYDAEVIEKRPAWNKGLPLSEEHKRNISEARKRKLGIKEVDKQYRLC